MFARSVHKVLRLVCLDASPHAHGVCKKGEYYYLRRTAPWGDEPGNLGGGLATACLLHDDPAIPFEPVEADAGVIRRRMSADEPTANTGRKLSSDGVPAVTEVCTPPMTVDDLAMVFGPTPEDDLPNSADLCGYYFLPYEVLETLSVRFGGAFASEIDIRWTASSYARAPRSRYTTDLAQAEVDWALVERGMRTQAAAEFRGGPFPDHQRIVDA